MDYGIVFFDYDVDSRLGNVREFELVRFTRPSGPSLSLLLNESPIRSFNCLTQNDEEHNRVCESRHNPSNTFRGNSACIGESCDVDILIVTQLV